MGEHRALSDGALSAIGGTPLIALDRLSPASGRIWAKLEFLQPGGSVKDRAALAIIRRAYAIGDLVPGKPVVEMTSGNMGAGLAVVCAVTGNPFVAVMSAGNSPARAAMMRGLGAQVELVAQVDGTPGRVTGADIGAASARARELADEADGYLVDQFNNPGAVLAHELGTGPELWAALGGRLRAFVAAVGSGGSFVGVARSLKRCDERIVCAAVEPAGAEVLAGRTVTKPAHPIQGTGYGIVPPHWQPELADVLLSVDDDEVLDLRQRLGAEEGLFVGFSAAANVCGAIKLLASGRVPHGSDVATLLCDTGLKYDAA